MRRAPEPNRFFQGLFWVFAFWIVVGMVSCQYAHSANLELGVSQTSLGSAGDNIWYDQTYEHRNKLRPWGLQFGVSNDLNSWLGWRATGIYFGHPINSAVWPDDADYFSHNRVPASFRGEGSGEVYGATVAPVFFHTWENFRVEAEAGALIYQARWREQFQTFRNGPWIYYSQGWHTDWTPYFGITARYKQVFFSYRKYRDIWSTDAVFGNSAKQLTLGWSQPF